MGGYGILDLASTYPNLFAALIPICGGTILNQLQHLTKIPIWMFHGEKDDVIPVESSTLIYEYLHKKNKNNLLTIPIIIQNFKEPVMNILLLIELSFFTLSLEELIINTF